jgi:hypothetical protein
LKKRDRNLRELFELEKGSPAPSAWVGLGTIAYEIVTHFRPQRIVELGSFGGFSTCVMGLALRDLNQGGQVYAVDSWTGDKHTGSSTRASSGRDANLVWTPQLYLSE